MYHRHRHAITLAVLPLLLGACATQQNAVLLPTLDISESTRFSVMASDEASMLATRWWGSFDSPALQEIINKVIAGNTDLTAMTLQIQQSRLELAVAGAARQPVVTGGLSASAASAPSIGDGSRETSRAYDLNTGISWEADLWGRLANSNQAAAARLLATQADADAFINATIAQTIRSVIGVAFDQRQIEATKRIIKNRSDSLAIVKDRYRSGVESTSVATVSAAEETLAAARADLPVQQLSLIKSANQLSLLAGEIPRSDTSMAASYAKVLPASVTSFTGLTLSPLDLLERRPDVRAAHARLNAANANIAVSLAERFPRLTLGGLLRSSADGLDMLLDLDNLALSLTTDIMATLFDGGRAQRQSEIRRAEAEAVAAQYVGTVLTALTEVENTINAELLLTRQSRFMRKRLTAARKTTEITTERYRSGFATYLSLLDASRSEALAQTAWLNVERSRWLNRVDLLLALGGLRPNALPGKEMSNAS
ncbi:MAG: efflux transporter outer membrane subunit [Pseudomonadota bacterium]